MYSAPTAAWVSAISRKCATVSGQASALCRMPQPVPATTRMPYSSHHFCSSFGSLGKYPQGPVSMTSNPASAISCQAWRGGICFGSSGNHTPHWSGHTPMVSFEYLASFVLRAFEVIVPVPPR